MKKITLITTILCGAIAFGQQSFTELGTQDVNNENNSGTATITRVDNGRAAVVDTFANLADFTAAVDENCPVADLSLEIFDNGPAAIMNCGTSISSAGDACFAAGEIEEGFAVEASNGTDIINIPTGAIGNAEPLVGSNTFAEFTTITFDPSVFAAGFDIWNNSDPLTTLRIFGEGDVLIETFDLAIPVAAETFFGFYADEPVTRIEMEGANASGELLGNFSYGAVCVLGLEDSALEGASLFPNPVTNVLNINLPSGAELNEVTVYSIEGRNMNVTFSDNTIDVSSLSTGMYLVNIETSAGTFTQKVSKR